MSAKGKRKEDSNLWIVPGLWRALAGIIFVYLLAACQVNPAIGLTPASQTQITRVSPTSTLVDIGVASSSTVTQGEIEVTDTPTLTPVGTSKVLTPTLSSTEVRATSSPTPIPRLTATAVYEPSFPIRAAFYYPWFPEAWKQKGFDPFTNYTPALGYYDSSSIATIQQHIADMAYANIQAGIISWWGQGTATDRRIATILAATHSSTDPSFRWTLYYEQEGQGDPSVEQIQKDLQYIKSHYASDPSFLHVGSKFVIFVYNDANDSCGMADRWVQANDNLNSPAYLNLKVFPGYRSCASQPDSWHQYAPAQAVENMKGFSFTISPGFWLKGSDAPRLERSIATWKSSIQKMLASNAPWQLVTTFNEWGEGTAVEPASQWMSPSGFGAYLDVLHNMITSADK